MKKILSILISLLLISQSVSVFANNTQPEITSNTITQQADTIKVQFSLKAGYCHSINSQAVLDISNSGKTYTKIIDIGNEIPSQEVTLYVDAYSIGDTFTITPTAGAEKLYYNGNVYTQTNPLLLTPEFSTENGSFTQKPISIEYVPYYQNAVNISYNGTELSFTAVPRHIGANIIAPIDELATALGLTYTLHDGAHKVSSGSASIIADSAGNVSISGNAVTPVVSPMIISNKLFVPVELFASAFGFNLSLSQGDDKATLNIASTATQSSSLPANYVNSKGLSSQTDYLIWVSKSDYTVRVYLGSQGNWNEIKSFTCAIGAPKTPTCEGTYRYYQSQPKWDYGSYYVGPIMRFNGGYAIHSTLMYYSGVPKDNRVGMKLSLGCVRLRPEDINWLFYYVPLYTTIHITG